MLGGWFSTPKEPEAHDINKVEISITKAGEQVAKGSGNYTAFIEINNRVLWKQTDKFPQFTFLEEGEGVLPSSIFKSEFRKLLKATEFDAANT